MRYLADSRGTPDNWYPKDLKKRAQVDMYLDQHHGYLRAGIGGYIFKLLFSPTMTGITFKESELSYEKTMQKRSLRLIEARLVATRYLCSDEVSIADLSAACELDQSKFIGLDLDPYPKTKAWLYHMIDDNPTLLEIHGPMRQFAAMALAKAKKEAAAAPKL